MLFNFKFKPFTVVLLLLATCTFAQTGIGTSTPHASAKLDVYATNKGFLPPRIALTATNAANPVTSPATGLLVFNTETAGTAPNNVTPGYYYWDGSLWVRLNGPSDTAANVTGVVPVVNGGTGVTTATGSGKTVLSNNPTLELLTISSGATQFPSSIFVNPTTFATSKRAALWLGDWGLLQDYEGNGQQNFSITQNFSGSYPTRFFIGTDGNVGIGTTNPTSYASNTLQVNGASSASIKITNTVSGIGNADGLDLYQDSTDSYLWNRTNGMMTFGTNNVERMRITSGGNIILNNGSSSGGNSTSTPLNLRFNNDFSNGYTDASLKLYLFNSGSTIQGFASGPAYDLQYHSSGSTSGRHAFYVANNEIMRINSSNVLIGTTSGTGALEVWSDGSSRDILHLKTTYASTGSRLIGFINSSGSEIGSVIQNGGSSVAFNTSSDYRLKEDFKTYKGLELVNKIKTYDFAWKSDSTRMYGVKAHELQAVLPYMVSGEKDAVDKDGKMITQSVDYSKLTPILVKAIQEQDVKMKLQEQELMKVIEEKKTLEQRIAHLELLINQLIKK